MRLEGKIAIITGSGRGMGRAMALAFAREGASLVLAARTKSEIDSVSDEIKSSGQPALVIPTDVRIAEQVNRLVDRTVAEFGRVDILVNNAGGYLGTIHTPITKLSLESWQNVINTNLTSVFLCSKVALKHMLKQRSGNIINVSSSLGQRGSAGSSAYTAAKHGVEGLTKAVALEVAPFNIRVNALHPGGPVAITAAINDQARDSRQLLQPQVVCELAVFLASDDSTGVTGQIINAQQWNNEREDIRRLIPEIRDSST